MEGPVIFIILVYMVYAIYLIMRWKRNRLKNHFFVRGKAMRDIVVFLFLIFMTRLAQVQMVQRDEFKRKQIKQIARSYPLKGERGNIYDANGKALAFNYNIYDLSLDPFLAVEKDKEKVFNALKEMIDRGYISGNLGEIKKDIENLGKARKRYKPLAKKLTEEEKKSIDRIQEKYGLPRGRKVFYYDTYVEREYYKDDIFKPLLGYIGFTSTSGSKKVGMFGLEKQYEEYLKEIVVEKTSTLTGKKTLLPNSRDEFRLGLNGNNLHLTVDYELQYILNDEVKKQFDRTGSQEAYAVVLDPNSGKILATSFFTRNRKSIRNPIFQDQFEPGSIFKPITVASALNEGYIHRNSTFDVGEGVIEKYRHKIRESTRSIRGILTLEEALKRSSNVSMVRIGDMFTEAKLEEYLKRFGFYERTGVDFPSEKKPYTIESKKWDKLKKSNVSFGQGIVVTPIQMTAAFAAVINGGKLYRPYLVEKITDSEGTVIRRNTPKMEQIIDPKNSEIVKNMLEGTVETGTGTKAKVEGYRIGGKTGTAQISGGKSGYLKGEYIASFVGFFPLENPQYVMLFMFYRPQGKSANEKYGGTVAAPPFAEVTRRLVKNKNIISHNVSAIRHQEIHREDKAAEGEDILKMPDLKGFSAREVSNLFKSRYYRIEMIGTGRVYAQEPKDGEELKERRDIKVYLK